MRQYNQDTTHLYQLLLVPQSILIWSTQWSDEYQSILMTKKYFEKYFTVSIEGKDPFLTFILLVVNLADIKWCKKPEKWLKPWHMGTHLRVLSTSFPMNTNMTGLSWFSKIFWVLRWIASALEGSNYFQALLYLMSYQTMYALQIWMGWCGIPLLPFVIYWKLICQWWKLANWE